MEQKPDLIEFISEDGEKEVFSVTCQVTIAGTEYLLVTDGGDEENAYIMKKTGEEGSQSVFGMVEDEEEFNAISKVFMETLEDIDFEMGHQFKGQQGISESKITLMDIKYTIYKLYIMIAVL